MSNLKIKFTIRGANSYSGKLSAQCTVEGTSKRHYMVVPDIKCENYEKWNEELQCFIGTDKAAVTNNGILGEVKERLEKLMGEFNFATGKELFEAFRGEPSVRKKKEPTLGEFLEMVYEEERDKDVGASSNYQLYFTLLHKLRGVNLKKRTTFTPPSYLGLNLCDTPLSQISDFHFRALGEWIKAEHNGAGYRNLMTTFAATIERAAERYPNIQRMNYKWRKEMSRKTTRREQLTAAQALLTSRHDVPALTAEEFNRFVNFDLSTIAPPQKHRQRLVEIYFDTVLLMYFTASRPADVIQWDWTHNYCEQTRQITYIPHKLRNRGGKRVTITCASKRWP